MSEEELLETLYKAAKRALHERRGTLHPFEVIEAVQETLHFNDTVFGKPELSPFEVWELIQAIATEALNPYDEV